MLPPRNPAVEKAGKGFLNLTSRRLRNTLAAIRRIITTFWLRLVKDHGIHGIVHAHGFSSI